MEIDVRKTGPAMLRAFTIQQFFLVMNSSGAIVGRPGQPAKMEITAEAVVMNHFASLQLQCLREIVGQ
jgi:hypothetical protein